MSQAELMTWFKEWKDVVTAAVAILAIFVVVYQSGRFERKRLLRDQAAARATLPLTLNALTEYGHDMIDALFASRAMA